MHLSYSWDRGWSRHDSGHTSCTVGWLTVFPVRSVLWSHAMVYCETVLRSMCCAYYLKYIYWLLYETHVYRVNKDLRFAILFVVWLRMSSEDRRNLTSINLSKSKCFVLLCWTELYTKKSLTWDQAGMLYHWEAVSETATSATATARSARLPVLKNRQTHTI